MTTKTRTLDDYTKLCREVEDYLRKIKPNAFLISNIGKASGPALSLVALDMYGIRRRWYERIPRLGDRWIRHRMRDAWNPARVRPAGVPVEVFEAEMAELQGRWSKFRSACQRWARTVLRWITGDRP